MASLSRTSSTGSLVGGGGRAPSSSSMLAPDAVPDLSPSGGGGGAASSPSTVAAGGGAAGGAGMGSDDEDSEGRSTSLSYKERRREAHTQAEQKRRDAIKKGYDYLQDLVPTCSQQTGEASGSGHKVSKATVLQKSIDYIQFVQQQKKKQEEELNLLRKEVIALQIMRANYEQLVKAHKSQSFDSEKTFVPAEVKFQTFQLLMDKLFNSFNEQVGMNSFSELSGCVFSWLEERCKPQMLQELMYDVLADVRVSYQELEQQQQNQLKYEK